MCKKERKYEKERIEVCRNCHGSGLTPEDSNSQSGKCPVCAGSGRIKKTLHVEVTIEPYTGSTTP